MSLVSWKRLEFILETKRSRLKEIAEKAGRFYSPFDTRKLGTAKWRHIDNPQEPLKSVQKSIYTKLLKGLALPPGMNGGVTGRSVLANAICHVGQPTLVTLDLRNHFGNINSTRVYRAYIDVLGCSPDIAAVLTKLTTFQHRIPQGASTSSMLANLVFLPAHDELSRLAVANGLHYTVFVDDIALSGEDTRKSLDAVMKILSQNGFSIARKKVFVMDQRGRQVVTGKVVNKSVSVGRDKREAIRSELMRARQAGRISVREVRSLMGKVAHARQVNPEQGSSLMDLATEIVAQCQTVDGDVVSPRAENRDCVGRCMR